MYSNQGKLVIVSAPSGAGKTTIVKALMQHFDNLSFSVSATSRLPRGTEQHGIDYYFLSANDFKALIAQSAFVEWEEVYPGQFYGTLLKEIDQKLQQGVNVIFDVDVKGGLNIKSKYGENALAIFIQPPSLGHLEERLRFRSTETEEKIQIRLAKSASELSFANNFDMVILNDNLDKAIAEAIAVVGNFINPVG